VRLGHLNVATKKNPAVRGFFLADATDQIASIFVAAGPFWPTPAT
jgi:hypothetical protein